MHTQVEKAEAEAALEEAIPALEEAAAALQDLRREDITEIRSFAKPHVLVQKVRAPKTGEDVIEGWGHHQDPVVCQAAHIRTRH